MHDYPRFATEACGGRPTAPTRPTCRSAAPAAGTLLVRRGAALAVLLFASVVIVVEVWVDRPRLVVPLASHVLLAARDLGALIRGGALPARDGGLLLRFRLRPL